MLLFPIAIWPAVVTGNVLVFVGSLVYREGDDQNRVDPLSIPRRYTRVFFPLLSLLWTPMPSYLIYDATRQTAASPQEHTLPWWHIGAEIATGALSEFDDIGLSLTFVAILLTPLLAIFGRWAMKLGTRINEQFLPRKFRSQLNQARTEARTEASREWAAWVSHMQAAQARGEDFAEPPPTKSTRFRRCGRLLPNVDVSEAGTMRLPAPSPRNRNNVHSEVAQAGRLRRRSEPQHIGSGLSTSDRPAQIHMASRDGMAVAIPGNGWTVLTGQR